jgi:hypothetical protein
MSQRVGETVDGTARQRNHRDGDSGEQYRHRNAPRERASVDGGKVEV